MRASWQRGHSFFASPFSSAVATSSLTPSASSHGFAVLAAACRYNLPRLKRDTREPLTAGLSRVAGGTDDNKDESVVPTAVDPLAAITTGDVSTAFGATPSRVPVEAVRPSEVKVEGKSKPPILLLLLAAVVVVNDDQSLHAASAEPQGTTGAFEPEPPEKARNLLLLLLLSLVAVFSFSVSSVLARFAAGGPSPSPSSDAFISVVVGFGSSGTLAAMVAALQAENTLDITRRTGTSNIDDDDEDCAAEMLGRARPTRARHRASSWFFSGLAAIEASLFVALLSSISALKAHWLVVVVDDVGTDGPALVAAEEEEDMVVSPSRGFSTGDIKLASNEQQWCRGSAIPFVEQLLSAPLSLVIAFITRSQAVCSADTVMEEKRMGVDSSRDNSPPSIPVAMSLQSLSEQLMLCVSLSTGKSERPDLILRPLLVQDGDDDDDDEACLAPVRRPVGADSEADREAAAAAPSRASATEPLIALTIRTSLLVSSFAERSSSFILLLSPLSW
jgi:hypothetical protein